MVQLVLNRKSDPGGTHSVESVLNVNDNVIEIYDVIVPWKFGDDDPSVTVQDITNVLNTLSGDVTVRINSRGGEVGSSLTIYNRLREYNGKVTTVVDGYAFSSAGWVAQAGDNRVISRGGIFMIHNPIMYPEIKSAKDLESVSNQWNTHRESILNIFEDRVAVDRDRVSDMMERETFLSAEEAVENGFFDSIGKEEANLAALNYATPSTMPDRFRDRIPSTSEPVVNVDYLKNLRRKYSTI